MSDLHDKPLLDRIFLKSRGPLFAYLQRSVRSVEQCEDLLHDCYVRLMGSLPPLRGESDTRAYLFTIARNLMIDSFRTEARRGYANHIPLEEVELRTEQPEPPDAFETERLRGRLRSALMGLSPPVREVFRLSRFEELTYEEIARRLAVSTRTVERRMSHALETLRLALDESDAA